MNWELIDSFFQKNQNSAFGTTDIEMGHSLIGTCYLDDFEGSNTYKTYCSTYLQGKGEKQDRFDNRTMSHQKHTPKLKNTYLGLGCKRANGK